MERHTNTIDDALSGRLSSARRFTHEHRIHRVLLGRPTGLSRPEIVRALDRDGGPHLTLRQLRRDLFRLARLGIVQRVGDEDRWTLGRRVARPESD